MNTIGRNGVTLAAIVFLMTAGGCRKSASSASSDGGKGGEPGSQAVDAAAKGPSAHPAPPAKPAAVESAGATKVAGAAATGDIIVDVDTAHALLGGEENVFYLDVRTVGEFEEGHPQGAWNVPILNATDAGGMVPNEAFLATVAKRFPKDATIICGCRTGTRSLRAATALREAGYGGAVSMVGGFVGKRGAGGELVAPGWQDKDYPIETGDGGERGYATLQAEP